jgi:hypothetical protein
VKPLADHGTTARAKGRPSSGIPGCSCPACRAAENAYDKRRRYLNATGRSLMVDTAPVAAHLRHLFEADAGWSQLAAATGCSSSTLHAILTGRIAECRRATANKILAVRAGDAIPHGRMVPAVGSIRRLHALLAAGHRCLDISAASGVEHSMISDLVNERLTVVKRHVAERIDCGYRKLVNCTGTSARSKNRALRGGWAPPGAWDDIDDPNACPEWTGYCGTDRGYWTHRQQKLPMCQRCQQAHDEWMAEHEHLGKFERNKRAFAARAAASTREADLAADAREIKRLCGVDDEQAAARLGVTRQHLQQAMLRHPAPADDQQLAA